MTTPSPATAREGAERSGPPHRYNAALADRIETRWQTYWQTHETFRTPNPGDSGFDATRPKFFCMDMFPYPSGAGLHVGHPEGYTATDIVCRYKRHRGFNVLHPMGWDAFGLPAEQYAIQTGVHPAKTTRTAIGTFRRQLQRFGFCYDWSREFATIDEDYYGWTQWIWLKAYHAWYDHAANRARPIEELITHLQRGERAVGEEFALAAPTDEGARAWTDLDEDQQREFIDGQRLAYLARQTVNWCPKLGTALANEEVIDGRSERGGFPVHRKPLKQWMFRITAYADRLLEDLAVLDWPESTRSMQREWIGRSEGAEIDFVIADPAPAGFDHLRVFTTRPDTVFGATYMVVAPEHPLVEAVLAAPGAATDVARITAYVNEAKNRADVDRMADSREKTGVALGIDAVNPATGQRIAVWAADYVLMGYGTGAIMAVPGQDERDWAFAETFDLPIVRTVKPPADFDGKAYTGDGPAMNSGFLDGMNVVEAKRTIIDWLTEHRHGRARVQFKLRDWLFSRQRYWGEPFPIVYDAAGNHYPVAPQHLPVTLPDMADYQPVESEDPQPLLAKAHDWVNTTAGAAGVDPALLAPDTPVTRETNTMPGWAGSCWYYLRYCDPHRKDRFVGRDVERYWMLSARASAGDVHAANAGDGAYAPHLHHRGGVDLYIGGAEHAVLHLLYARFWHKILFDFGEVSTPEPFGRLFHQGLILSHAFQRSDKSLVPNDQVVSCFIEGGQRVWKDTTGQPIDEPGFADGVEVGDDPEGTHFTADTGEAVQRIVAKMSKSLKNVVNPDDVIASYGADTFRLYEMYLGPLEASKPWNTNDIIGPFRFLQRAWRLVVDEETGALRLRDEADIDTERALHRTIAKVEHDIERLAFNTAIAAMIEFVNESNKAGGLNADQLRRFIIVLSPFAPHMAEELWSKLGHTETLANEPWPTHDPALLVADEIEMPVQILGKVRSKITVAADADATAIEKAALADPRIVELLTGMTVRKVIVVPGKIVNVIAG